MSSKATRRKQRTDQQRKGTRRRYSAKERRQALELVVAGMSRPDVAEAIGCSVESVRVWYKAAEAKGTLPEPPGNNTRIKERKEANGAKEAAELAGANEGKQEVGGAMVPVRTKSSGQSIYTPRDPGQGLGLHEEEAILEYKKKFPSMQPAQLKKQLKRFKGWRISVKAIARVLKVNGYEMVHRGSRPEGPDPIRFEAPRRGALWQADFGEFRVAGERLHLLVVLDDFSRFAVGHSLADSPEAEVVVNTLGEAIARHGKPEALRTDRGGAFSSGELGRYLETELIDHIVGRSYHPQGGGKVESLIGTVRRELWDVEHFADRQVAERRLASFFESYNERRAHMGIDGLTPADRFFGRGDRVLAAIDAVSRQRQGSLALLERSGATIEELSTSRSGAPLEVLRLVIVDGTVELRFCGARVRLGTIEV
ncbi:MAG: DDE-type integrase/transposase/recombinase [Actinobacteria bacterium]|nr:DDE-type integrase/transposase/recombinase [Actinomycetota bacterium]